MKILVLSDSHGNANNMTQAQCKDALLRGQGRCLQAVQSDPARYAPVVLWACRHECAFDAQCEGSRAWFVYQLVGCYEDKTPFLQATMDALDHAKSNGGWRIFYLAELLSRFACDGESAAADALWRKYDRLYADLSAKKRRPNRYFAELDDFGNLCVILADSPRHMAKIAGDIGRLYRTHDFYDSRDFDWLHADKVHQYRKSLEKHAARSADIAAFLAVGRICRAEDEATRMLQPQRRHPQKGIALSIWLRKKADAATVQSYADAYLAQTDPAARTEALRAFSRCPFPGNPAPILADADAPCDALREAAWEALEYIRHPAVRDFAIARMEENSSQALPIFIANYQPQDEPRLCRLVSGLRVDRACTTNWHGIHLDILGMADKGLLAPLSLLRLIYETTYCSNCREYALRQLGKRRTLTDEMLAESLWDSNSDIRAYAKRLLARRKK